MQAENGVQSAVESFHAHLPLHNMMCDIMPGQVARWVVSKNKNRKETTRLSDQAIAILVAHKLVRMSDLKA